MSENKDKILIRVVVGIFGLAGITTLIYFFTKRKDKKTKNKDLKPNESPQNKIGKVETKKDQDVSPSDIKPLNLTQSHSEIPSQSTNFTNSSKKNFEIITSISLELNKKSDNFTINKDNVEFLSVIEEKTSYKEKEYKEDQGDRKTPTNRQRVNSEKAQHIKKFSKDKDTFFENDSPEKLPPKLSNSHVSNSPSKSTSNMVIYPPTSLPNSQPNNLANNFYDISILNLNDFKDQIKKSQAFRDLNIDLSISLERGILPADIQKVAGDERMFDSDGYIEEDEEDLKENLEGSPFHSFTNNPAEIQNRRKNSFDVDNFNLSNKNPKVSDKINNLNYNQDMEIKFMTNPEKIVISTHEQLHEVFYGKNKNEDAKYCLTYDDKEFILPNEEREVSPILKPKIVLMILKYLYGELHAGLIELSDNFVEERRKYFTVDQETYVSIINYFLRKKEEFFLCVLSDIMSKLDISQVNLDKTFFYYMNIADPNEDEIILSIREAYDKVYHAGVKYSIAPKYLTKTKLKLILNFQCEIYEKLMKESNNYPHDVIEIMVTDYVYLEYGFDREAIRAAIIKHNIQEDPEFSEILKWLESIKNSSFLNI